jgi:hypothetical protein
MPIGNVTRTDAVATVTLRDLGGEVARVSVSAGSFTGAQALAFATAVGQISNARVESLSTTTVNTYSLVLPFDEAYASVTVKAMLIYQNLSTGQVVRVEIPAPDASIFLADGVTVNAQNTLVLAVSGAIQAIIGSGFTLRRAFLSQRSRRIIARPLAPGSAEPGTGQLPPGEPALPPQ